MNGDPLDKAPEATEIGFREPTTPEGGSSAKESMRRRRIPKLTSVARVAYGDLLFEIWSACNAPMPSERKFELLSAAVLRLRARYL